MALEGGEDPKVSLDGMVNRSLRAKIERLIEVFPYRTTSEIKNSLEISQGNLDDAADLLAGSPGPSSSQIAPPARSVSSPSQNSVVVKVKDEYEDLEDIPNLKTREKVANLVTLGTSHPIPFILDILGNCNWNVDEAANILLGGCMVMGKDGDIEESHEPVAEDVSQTVGDGASSTSTTFDPTPPPTPPSPQIHERYPGGVIPSLVLSLGSGDQILPNQPKPKEVQSVGGSSGEKITEPAPRSSSTDVDINNTVLNQSVDKENPETIKTSRHCLDNDTEMANSINERNEAAPVYGFGNDTETSLGKGMDEKIAILRELVPRASKNRCQAILQLWPESMEEAFEALWDEIEEYGSDGGDDESEDDESTGSNDGSETEETVQGKYPKASAFNSGSKREQKRRAETPEEEPLAKKPRLVEEQHDEEAEAAKLEPAGEWVLNIFGESGGISITLASGNHPCKFPKSVLCRHFKFFEMQLNQQPAPMEVACDGAEVTLELLDVDRAIFDLAIQLAITKSLRLHSSQSRTRSIEITALLELVVLATRLGLSGAGHILAARLKEILVDRRNALQGSHIESAYTLKRGHPIRKVIVQSLGRAYLVLREGRMSKKAQLYRTGEGDNARRSAFGGERFMFQDQLDSILEFNSELSTQVIDIIHDRNEIMSRSGKTRTITYTDPLTEDEFSL